MESRFSGRRSPLYAPFVQPAPRDRARVIPEGAADPPADDDLPLIEQFLDELPSIEDYLEDTPVLAEVAPPSAGLPLEQDAEGWAIDGWQSYDWHSLAHLGRPSSGRHTSEEAWNPEPWPSMTADEGRVTHSFGDSLSIESDAGPSADEVAAALDDIAQRIRSGELPIDQFRSSPPEAAMAAVLAAMLRLRG